MTPLLASARFCRTVVDLRQLPAAALPELAFVGRSNAGKSTALNLLCQRRKLAYASRTPGRTQALNLFELGPLQAPSAYLVDTPGYGYAATPQSVRVGFVRLVGPYLRDRRNLIGCVLLLDCRRGLTELDRRLVQWLRPDTALLVLLTKADKLNRAERIEVERAVRQELPQCSIELFSALSRLGVDAAQRWVQALITR